MAKKKPATDPPSPVAILRDGGTIKVGDEVETDFHKDCAGVIFVVEKITEYPVCESGFLVVAHVKGNPERRMTGIRTGTLAYIPAGLDCNHFRLLKK